MVLMMIAGIIMKVLLSRCQLSRVPPKTAVPFNLPIVCIIAGTAVNPTLRAAHLAAVTDNEIVLVVPFLPVQDQIRIFPEGITCSTPEQQAALIKAWATEHSNLPEVNFKVPRVTADCVHSCRCL
eukprot:GHRR01022852.1.p2 GENE.GHRR01022852.1~~GHRR01022852.1.p2  ORF type:complete len:125 (-),score=28.22 GHRR01022852.1:255-629(-)